MQDAPYEYVEHPADLRFRAYGSRLEECFENAAKAMFSSIADPKTVTPREAVEIELESDSLEGLLHDWLSEILYVFEDRGMVFSGYEAEIDEKSFRLTARIYGERIDPKRHAILTDIKAVTYHEMSIKKEGSRWSCEVLCDV